MLERMIVIGVAAGLFAGVLAGGACAQEVIKVGAVLSMTGPFNTNGRDVMAGAELYLQQHGDTVAGKQIKIILKDDASKPDVARRAAQELIVNEKVGVLIAGISPAALSIASLSTEAKIATVVAISGTSAVVERSPYMVRTSFTLGQSSAVIADWATKNGAKKIVTLVADFAPGQEAERAFKDVAVKNGAQVVAVAARAVGQRRLRAVPAAGARSRAGHPVRLRAEPPGEPAGQTVPRARDGQVRHPLRRHRRPHPR